MNALQGTSHHLLRALALVSLTGALGCSGCNKEKEKPSAEAKTEAPAPAPTAKAEPRRASQRTQPDEGVEVPTEEDFEEQVEKQITATSNLQKELDQIEKQISGG